MIYNDKDDTRLKAKFILDKINRLEDAEFKKSVRIYKTGATLSFNGENLESLVEILEKHTPLKVIKNGICPNCNNICLIDYMKIYHPPFCFRCGQALDWRNEL